MTPIQHLGCNIRKGHKPVGTQALEVGRGWARPWADSMLVHTRDCKWAWVEAHNMQVDTVLGKLKLVEEVSHLIL